MGEDLSGCLPFSLRQDVIYAVNREILFGMFGSFESENFLKELAQAMESVIFLPGDYVIYYGEKGREMYFIAEGSVFILSNDKQTVIDKLYSGGCFGEHALFQEIKRTFFVQAEDFCIIKILKREDFDRVAGLFPAV